MVKASQNKPFAGIPKELCRHSIPPSKAASCAAASATCARKTVPPGRFSDPPHPSSSIANCAGVRAILPSLARRPDKPTPLQPLQKHAAPLAMPPDDFHGVTPAATEHEQMPTKRALLQHRLGLRRQGRKALAHRCARPPARPARSAEPRSSRKPPDQARQCLRTIPAADPKPLPARQFDLGPALGDGKAFGIGSGMTHNLDRQETGCLRRHLKIRFAFNP